MAVSIQLGTNACCKLQALGGLVGFLLQNRVVNELELPTSPIAVNEVRYFTLYVVLWISENVVQFVVVGSTIYWYIREDVLYIDQNTLDALQLFKCEQHPSQLGIGSTKEGLSLFGLLNQAKTPPGRRLLR
jgi:DNA mismatch repair ATPase MutS